MSSVFRIGQVLKGRLGKYTITKEIQDTVWFATNQAQETVVIKSVEGHPRVENERDVLKRFQNRTPHLRPLLDEIEEPPTPITIGLRYLENHLMEQSIKKALNRKEIKHVSRCILEAIKVLHDDGYVHTDVKPNNVFVNLQEGDMRFSEVQLGDLGGCYPVDSEWATSGEFVGAPLWTSPEVHLNMPWNTATDIWSFGATLISLIYGADFNLFKPKGISRGDEQYMPEILRRQYRYFGPFPQRFVEIVPDDAIGTVISVVKENPTEKRTPFYLTTEREVIKRDNVFISKMMKLDWRDRPTAKELLEDEWWGNDEA